MRRRLTIWTEIKNTIKATKALRILREDHSPHPIYLPGHELQCHPRWPAVRQLWSEDRCTSGLPAITVVLIALWRLQQQAGTTQYNGHCWGTSTLLTIRRSYHTTTIRCKTRPPASRPHQQGQDLRSDRKTRRKSSWRRSTPLPHTSHSQRRASQGGGVIHQSGKRGWREVGHRQRCQSEDRKDNEALVVL